MRIPTVGLAGKTIIALCAVLSWQQARVWRTELTLWQHAVAIDPLRPGPHLALGVAYQHLDRFKDARQEYGRTVELAHTQADWDMYSFAIGINEAKIRELEGHLATAILLLDAMGHQFPERQDVIYSMETGMLKRKGMTCAQIRAVGRPC
jgi:hypothetical protein